MKIGENSEAQLALHQHSEKEITSKYINEEDGEKLCYITNFEFRDVQTNLFKSPESLSDEGVRLVLTGVLLTLEQVKLYYSSINNKNSNLQKGGRNIEKELESNYRVAITNLSQWVFDNGEELHAKGIWVQTRKVWYKLIKPSEYFKMVYAPFEKKSNVWLDLRPILLKWMKMFDKCSDDRVSSVLEMMNLEYVMKTMGKKGYSESDITENADFIYDKAVQDLDTFSLEDDPDVNQVLKTKFIQELFTKPSLKKSRVLDLNYEYDYPPTKSKKKEVVYYSSEEDDFPQVQLELESSESSSSSEEEYKFEEENPSEDEYHSMGEEVEKNSEEEEEEKPSSKKREIRNDFRQRKKRKIVSEEEYKPKPLKKGSDIHVTTYTLEPGIPSASELLQEEFTPRLLTKLSCKYEMGVWPSMCSECRDQRINCFKERPICSHCLERGVPCVYPKYLRLAPCTYCALHRSKVCNRQKPNCNHCKEGECFYFTSDTGLLIAQMKIKAVKELYAKLDAENTEEQKEDDEISVSLSQTLDDTEENDESLEYQENKKKAKLLKEEIEKWKTIAEAEENFNRKKLKELNSIIEKWK